MSMQDPIADLLTHIRNGQLIKKKTVKLTSSSNKVAIVKVLQMEGYIEKYEIIGDDPKKPNLKVTLKYFNKSPVIKKISRVSRPGLRIYKAANKLPKVLGGLGIAIISTSNGVMSGQQAIRAGYGGEVLCIVE